MGRHDRVDYGGPLRLERSVSCTDGVVNFCVISQGGSVDDLLEIVDGSFSALLEPCFRRRPMRRKGKFCFGSFCQDTVFI